ncbi:hypothetical protein CK203_019784 [Vitis vinifera]|uniref:Uncharacterized protein n=1 Tax=Vitis vinifera TaxID=29760 RepID=A0A438JQG8_VITVI|nr:hypothetical protein CK203_019784 [Vitis vinifera]
MEKRKTGDENSGHSCSLSLHFWSTSRSPFFTFYIPFQSSESQNPTVQTMYDFGAEMRKIWPSEDNCIRLAKISHDGNQGATPYSLVYGMKAVLLVETETGSLRVALEQQIYETEWTQARFDQLNLLDERRLRAADHVQAYQRKMARAFKKRDKPRPLQKGDLVLRILRGLIGDPKGKFRPS